MTREPTTEKRPESDWRADLESDDAARVVSALHEACPCTGSAELYEKFLPILNRFKKDPRPEVRRVAIHLEVDAFGRLVEDQEHGGGFIRNRPGGNGRRRETRRPHLRYGDGKPD